MNDGWVATSMEVTEGPPGQGDLQITGQDQEGGVCQLPNAEPKTKGDQRVPQASLGFIGLSGFKWKQQKSLFPLKKYILKIIILNSCTSWHK